MLELGKEIKSELTFFLKKWQKCGLNLTDDLLVTNDLGDKKVSKLQRSGSYAHLPGPSPN